MSKKYQATLLWMLICVPLLTWAHPSQWLNTSGLGTVRHGQVSFRAHDNNDLTAYTYRSTEFDPISDPIWFVLHGSNRNAADYRDYAAPIAERNAALVIAIGFPEALYPDYNQDPALYTEVEHFFSAILEHYGGDQAGYYLFGHSAGAQFTHRMLTFYPNARVLGAVAANAGWYTLPNRDYEMPYGLADSGLTDDDIAQLLDQPMTVLVGENDTATPAEDPNLRGTWQAMEQGSNRYERGHFYYEAGRETAASQCNEGCCHGEPNWNFNVVPRAEHSSRDMIMSAAPYLFEMRTICLTGSGNSSHIIIREILADPASGSAGDANGDGVTDYLEDEFVRLENVGDSPVCLSGWTLSDVSRINRFVFPLGGALEPGESVVVFGGGLPVASSLYRVLTPRYERSLSLSNSGDVLTLRNSSDDLVDQVSWGDCDDATCASDHIEGSLNINRSVTKIDGVWR